MLRPGEDVQLLSGAHKLIKELNTTPGKLLPGVRIDVYSSSADERKNDLWIYGMMPTDGEHAAAAALTRKIPSLLSGFPEVERIMAQDNQRAASSQVLAFVHLNADAKIADRDRPRTKTELIQEFDRLLSREAPGASFLMTETPPEEMPSSFPGVMADHLLKVIGPDLDELQRLGKLATAALRAVPGVKSAVAYPVLGSADLEFKVDADKCKRWGVSPADVSQLLQTAVHGKDISSMIEGERIFDIVVRWPLTLRRDEGAILDIPVDVIDNGIVVPGNAAPEFGCAT